MSQNTIIDKRYRLLRDLNFLVTDFRKSSFSGAFKVKIDTVNETYGAYYLRVEKVRFFRFHQVVACVYPKIAGGEEKNTFDILTNRQTASQELLQCLQELIRNLPAECETTLGEVSTRDTLEPFTNHLVEVNRSYDFPVLLRD